MGQTDILKVEALCWLRFTKHMLMAMTEVGRWNADVLGISNEFAIEVEVKVSKADLVREFVTKQAKHWFYRNAQEHEDHIPQYFYVIVPEELEKDALTILEKEAPKAGLLIFTKTFLRPGENVRVAKKATKLREGPPSPRVVRTAILRMGSELARCKLAALKAKVEHEALRDRDQSGGHIDQVPDENRG